jgi:hypothetical protein
MRGLIQACWIALVALSIAPLSGCSHRANSEVAGRVGKEATVIGATAAKTAADLKAAGAKSMDGPKTAIPKADP